VHRRAFLAGSIALLSVRAATAQPASVRKIGLIGSAPRVPVIDAMWEELLTGLREHGWVESRNLAIERRYVDLGRDAGVAAAEELIRANVEVIVVGSTQTALAAKQTTRTVPIVMTIPADPVAVALVESLARPGGNVTGMSFVGTELAGKQVELLKAAISSLASLAVLVNPTNASHPPRVKEIVATARQLKVRVYVAEASSREQMPDALRTIQKHGAEALVVLGDAVFVREMDDMIRFGAEQRLPIMYALREAPLAGGFMSYGADLRDLFRRAADYVDKILRGAQPRDLPIEQASKFELIINLRTAKALGLTIPRSLLVRADHVIE
jgi:putative tryptophan/tyrosine transport system substrate-binding protein